MDYLRINSSKLKITLTSAECARYGIRESDGEYDSRLVRGVISDILEEAGAGEFCHPHDKLLVQLYPIRTGGAELFITKLSHVGERERRAITEADNLDTYVRERVAFSFNSLDALIAASKLPSLRAKAADLYVRDERQYILLLDEERLGRLSDCDILSEFGSRLPPAAAPRPEWDRLLASEDAIAKLSRL